MEYGLIGEKLGHSYSKIIHERLIDNYEYEIHPLAKNEVDAFMKEKAFKAMNVTIPYKQRVMPYLDIIEEAALKIGAVNTVVNKNGKLYGYNTDYVGFVYMLKVNNVDIQGKKVLVMGNGGASKAVQVALQDLGAKQCIIVDIVLSENVISLEEVYKNHTDVDVIVNTTPVGMYPNCDAMVLDLNKFEKAYACVDVIYNPLHTKFIQEARKMGKIGIGGLQMLVAQAKYALEHFKDIKIGDSEIERIYQEILVETSNICFIGMPGCGKTTISKMVAEKTNKKWIDIDEEIVKKINMSIRDFFEEYGEEKFREIETQVCEEVSKLSNVVISCGGGIVKNAKNIGYLRYNGVIVLLKRDFDLLEYDESRPLSSSKEALLKLYEERKDLYNNSKDVIVENNATVDEVSDKVIQVYKDKLKEF